MQIVDFMVPGKNRKPKPKKDWTETLVSRKHDDVFDIFCFNRYKNTLICLAYHNLSYKLVESELFDKMVEEWYRNKQKNSLPGSKKT